MDFKLRRLRRVPSRDAAFKDAMLLQKTYDETALANALNAKTGGRAIGPAARFPTFCTFSTTLFTPPGLKDRKSVG